MEEYHVRFVSGIWYFICRVQPLIINYSTVSGFQHQCIVRLVSHAMGSLSSQSGLDGQHSPDHQSVHRDGNLPRALSRVDPKVFIEFELH